MKRLNMRSPRSAKTTHGIWAIRKKAACRRCGRILLPGEWAHRHKVSIRDSGGFALGMELLTTCLPCLKGCERMFTTSRVADIIGVSVVTVRNWANDGRLSAEDWGGRLAVPLSEVQRLQAEEAA